MSELADFILARVAEEERACQRRLRGTASDELVSVGRLLLHCTARRKLVALHEIHFAAEGCDAIIDGECGARRTGQSEREFVCPTLRLLALPYFDHPDYQEKWRAKFDFADDRTAWMRQPQ
jgi:hypothetical protein